MSIRHVLIALFIAVQMGIPLHHYFAADNPYDPRFAWRMLLDGSVTTCATELRQDGVPVDVGREFGAHWASLTGGGRIHIARAMARRLCAKKPGSRVTISMRCNLFGGGEVVLADGTSSECPAP